MKSRDWVLSLLKRAIVEPLRWIATNAGHDGSIVIEKVKEGKATYGFNALTEVYEDLIQAGVIDPTKVVRCASERGKRIITSNHHRSHDRRQA